MATTYENPEFKIIVRQESLSDWRIRSLSVSRRQVIQNNALAANAKTIRKISRSNKGLICNISCVKKIVRQ